MSYEKAYADWQADPEKYWLEAAAAIDWITPPARAFNPEAGPMGRWFDGATCNTCWNCVDRHVEAGHGDRLALVYDSPVTQSVRRYTFAELRNEVAALAQVLQDRGAGKGDRVIIYMPMVPEAIFAMLACARIGAVHTVVFGGFAARELAVRIDDVAPKLIVSASCGIETSRVIAYKPLLDQAIETAQNKPGACLILQRDVLRCDMVAGRDFDLATEVAAAKTAGRLAPCVEVAATDPLYILHTSGTTGKPKGVVRDNGGHMVALRWSMEHHYGVRPGETFWAASDVGWVVGHSYICYAPLLNGSATVVYEGKPVGTPDAGAFWRVIADHGVVALFCAPTALRAIRREDPQGELIRKADLSNFRTLFLAGERSDPDTVRWAGEMLAVPVIDHWWQTETGWPITGNPVGLGIFPVRPGSPGKPMPGYEVRVLDDDGVEVPVGAMGNIAVRLPLPPSCFSLLWNAPERYRQTYFERFPGYYDTSDAGLIDADGYVFVMARTDDIINVAGHRLSTGAMEEVIASHPAIAECAVVGVADELKGQLPLGFYVTNARAQGDPEIIEQELVELVRQKIGPVAAFRTAVRVQRLPKTRSGKILRGLMQKIADGAAWTMPSTIDDPEIPQEIEQALQDRGLLDR